MCGRQYLCIQILIREIKIEDRKILSQLMVQLGYPITELDMENRINLYLNHSQNKAGVAEYYVARMKRSVIRGNIIINPWITFHSIQATTDPATSAGTTIFGMDKNFFDHLHVARIVIRVLGFPGSSLRLIQAI